MPREFGERFNPDEKESSPKEEKEPTNIIEYYEQDLKNKGEELEWLEIRKEALKDIIERTDSTKEDLINFLKDELKEFDIQARVIKSMMNLTEQRLAEKRTKEE